MPIADEEGGEEEEELPRIDIGLMWEPFRLPEDSEKYNTPGFQSLEFKDEWVGASFDLQEKDTKLIYYVMRDYIYDSDNDGIDNTVTLPVKVEHQIIPYTGGYKVSTKVFENKHFEEDGVGLYPFVTTEDPNLYDLGLNTTNTGYQIYAPKDDNEVGDDAYKQFFDGRGAYYNASTEERPDFKADNIIEYKHYTGGFSDKGDWGHNIRLQKDDLEWTYMIDMDEKRFIINTNGAPPGIFFEIRVEVDGMQDSTLKLRSLETPSTEDQLGWLNGQISKSTHWLVDTMDSDGNPVEPTPKDLDQIDEFILGPTPSDIIPPEGTTGEGLTGNDAAFMTIPGGRPGIQIKFKHPLQIVEDGNIIENADGTRFDLTTMAGINMEIGLKLEDTEGKEQAIALNFDLETKTQEKNEDEYSQNKTGGKYLIKYEDDYYQIDIVKDDVLYDEWAENSFDDWQDEFFGWPYLESSMILDEVKIVLTKSEGDSQGLITLDNNLFESEHTYLEFNLEIPSEETAYIRFKPYNRILQDDTYTLLVDIAQNNSEGKGTTIVSGTDRITVDYPNGTPEYQIRTDHTRGLFGWSQRLIYDESKQDSPFPPAVPTGVEITDTYAIANLRYPFDPDKVEAIGFDLSWNMPFNSESRLYDELEEKDLYYEVFFHTLSNTEEEDDKSLVKIFQITQDKTIADADSEKQVKIIDFTAENDVEGVPNISKKSPVMELYAGQMDGTGDFQFIVSDLQLKGIFDKSIDTIGAPILKEEYDKDKPDEKFKGHLGMTNYPSSVITEDESYNIQPGEPVAAEIPNVYYLTIRAVYDFHDDDVINSTTSETYISQKLLASNYSMPGVANTSIKEDIIPTIEKMYEEIAINKQTGEIDGHQIGFEIVNLTDYYQTMLWPTSWEMWDLKGVFVDDDDETTINTDDGDNSENRVTPGYILDDNRTYELFLYQDEPSDDIDDAEQGYIQDQLGPEFGIQGDANWDNDILNLNYSENSASNKLIYDMYEIESTTDGLYTPRVKLTDFDMQALRNGKVLGFYFDDNMNFNSRDGDMNLRNIIFEGLDSNQIYYTQARVKIKVARDPKLQGANLDPQKWTLYSPLSKINTFTTESLPTGPTPDEQTPIAPTDFKLIDVSSSSAKVGWTKAATITPASYELIRTNNRKLDEKYLDKQLTLNAIFQDNSDIVLFHNEEVGKATELTNIDLSPNTLYYYYLRSVITLPTGEEMYSDWVMLPVTTKSIQPPSSLKVELPMFYDYELKNEVVVSFMAPGPLDDSYSFEISIRGEDDEDYIGSMDPNFPYDLYENPERLNDDPSAETGYEFVDFLIQDLDSGKRYDIKVRVVQTQPDGTILKSLFSNMVSHRTEFDAEEEEKEDLFEDLLDKYDYETGQLGNSSFWEFDGSETKKVYKYRMSYLETDFAVSGSYDIINDEDMEKAIYYFPSEAFEMANDENTTLNFKIDDYAISIRPDTIDDSLEPIEDAKYEESTRRIEDYYIMVELEVKEARESVFGQEAIMPQLEVNAEVVSLEEEDSTIELEIEDSLRDAIAEEREDLERNLEQEFENPYIDIEYLESLVEKEIDDVKEKHQRVAGKIVSSEIDGDTTITEANNAISLNIKVDSNKINVYYLDEYDDWIKQSSFKVANGYSINAQNFGTYVITGQEERESVTVPSIPIKDDIISQYQLDDLFSTDEDSMQYGATKDATYQAVARMLGAPESAEPMMFLQRYGIDIIRTKLDEPIRQDEAIYVLMQAYEVMNKVDVDTVQLRNKQSITNIGAFQPKYQNYVSAAVALGIIDAENSQVIPSKKMSIESILGIIDKIVP
ncbi:hypothetical protein AN639_05160 [Candidatus Epulonipiscium fishelsonii]|nr:hypothetical protein AN639_05160 [Epulopiscium sp. SCG-B05WGA-EpuloA1]